MEEEDGRIQRRAFGSCRNYGLLKGSDCSGCGRRVSGWTAVRCAGVCRKFSREELLEGLSLAHLWNRKIYLTVNTLTKQDELSGLCDWIAPFYEAGLDGVIVQDMGVLEKLRKIFPAWSCMPARR